MKCGIDLGTTFSVISWYDEMNQRLVTIDLNCEDGQRILRSVVYYPGQDKEPVVGQIALNEKKNQPDKVVVGVKQSMGRTDWKFEPGDGEAYTPAQVSAEVLKTLISEAQQFLAEEVEELVVTVPAYFEEAQKNDTLEAAVLAGIPKDRVRLLEEPQAAALAYCIANATSIDDDHFLVYDLGGGTFDVVLIHAKTVEDGDNKRLAVDTLIKAGNAHLGGLQWDEKLAEVVVEKLKSEHDVDPTEDGQDEAILMKNCEDAKRALTRTSPVQVVGDRQLHQAEVTVAEFEDATSPLLFETRQLLEQVLDDAEQKHQVARDGVRVLLTGGSTRMPMVSKMVEEVTGKPPLTHGNPDLLVSMGAAYWAYVCPPSESEVDEGGDTPSAPPPAPAEIKVTKKDDDGTVRTSSITVAPVNTVTHYAVGIECTRQNAQGAREWYNVVMIPEGSKTGHDSDVEREFFKTEDGMKEVQITLYKSSEDTEDLEECTQMARFVIGPLPDGGKQGEKIRVKLGHSEDGLLCGEAEDVATGQKVAINIDRDAINSA